MKYKDLTQFERVHGSHFVYLLQQLDDLLEGKKGRIHYEGFDQDRLQLEQSIAELRTIVRKNRSFGMQESPVGTNAD